MLEANILNASDFETLYFMYSSNSERLNFYGNSFGIFKSEMQNYLGYLNTATVLPSLWSPVPFNARFFSN
jgi:hypothetical protein